MKTICESNGPFRYLTSGCTNMKVTTPFESNRSVERAFSLALKVFTLRYSRIDSCVRDVELSDVDGCSDDYPEKGEIWCPPIVLEE
jgi:hypothetical protein